MTQKGFWTPIRSMVLIYWLAFGFSALDRLLIAVLFPFVIPYFKLSFTQAGMLMTLMSVGFVIFSIIGGALSDKYGRKKVIIPSVIIFSLGSFVTGFMRSFGQLVASRFVIGAAEGAYFPAASAQISEESSPETRGRNLGIHTSALPIWGMFFAPIIGTQIAANWGWQWAFYLTIIPGIILALIVKYKVKETGSSVEIKSKTQLAAKVSWTEVIKEKNIIICILISIFYMVWSWSWMSFGTVYLADIKGFTPKMAGLIQSAFGIGGGLGMILMPAISDRIGRKSTIIVGNIIGILATIGVLNISGQNPALLYFLISLAAFTAMGSSPIFLAAIATESVPLERAAVAVGLTAGIGELSGAAMAPMFLGKIADLYSLSTSMTVGALCLLPVIAVALALRETAPRIVNVANAPTFAE